MTRKEAIEILRDTPIDIRSAREDDIYSLYATAQNMAIEALQQKPNLLCALADRECPFQGKEYAWCLTCPHISEEDRALVKKAALEPKRGHWTDTAGKPNDSQYSLYCSECDEWSEYRSRYCPNCGALMAGVREEDIE